MKENKINDEAVKSFFEKLVNESGHTFENEVIDIFEKKGIFVDPEVLYLDKDLQKGRAIDLIAYTDKPSPKEAADNQFGKYVYGQIRFIVECKSLPNHAWVFFGQRDVVEFDLLTETYFLSTSIENAISDGLWYRSINDNNAYAASTYGEYQYQDKQRKHNYAKENNLYESILAVTKATRHQIDEVLRQYWRTTDIERYKSVLGYVYFQPLIVFNGHMYKAIKQNDEVKLSPIKYAQIRKRYVSDKYDEHDGIIHIVHFSVLEEYLNIINRDYWQDDYVIRYQKKLLQSFDSTIKYQNFNDYFNRNM